MDRVAPHSKHYWLIIGFLLVGLLLGTFHVLEHGHDSCAYCALAGLALLVTGVMPSARTLRRRDDSLSSPTRFPRIEGYRPPHRGPPRLAF